MRRKADIPATAVVGSPCNADAVRGGAAAGAGSRGETLIRDSPFPKSFRVCWRAQERRDFDQASLPAYTWTANARRSTVSGLNVRNSGSPFKFAIIR